MSGLFEYEILYSFFCCFILYFIMALRMKVHRVNIFETFSQRGGILILH
jgi:hypothetical protein